MAGSTDRQRLRLVRPSEGGDGDAPAGQPLSRILIVEDNEAQRRTLCDVVRDEGFEPIPCATATDAIACVEEEFVPVAVVDLRLPDMSGTEVLKNLLERVNGMRVIIHTAYGSFKSAQDAVNLGAFAYVEKLTDPQQLVDYIHRAMDELLAEALWRIDGSLRSVTEQAPDMIIQIDPDGTISFINRPIPGYTVDEVVGGTVFDLVTPEYRETLEFALKTVFDCGRPQQCEIVIEEPGGSRSWYDCRIGPVSFKGPVVRAILIARNVTQDRQAEQLEQVVLNLFRNARDAVFSGGTVSIETMRVHLDDAYVASHPEARRGPHLLVSVSDTGPGMSKETLERMFEPFYSAGSVGEHVGLGLTEVYGIVAKAGGHITVESEPGQGTVFRVYIPTTGEDSRQSP